MENPQDVIHIQMWDHVVHHTGSVETLLTIAHVMGAKTSDKGSVKVEVTAILKGIAKVRDYF